MATKRVVAFYMHEHEESAAEQALEVQGVTESYVLGEIREEDIPALQEKGVIVHVLEDQPWLEKPGGATEPVPGFKVKSRAARRAPGTALPEIDLSKPNYYIIELKGPFLEQWRADLGALGVELLEYLPVSNYTARLTQTQFQAVSALPFVQTVQLYRSEESGPIVYSRSGEAPAEGAISPTGVKMLMYDLILHSAQDRDTVLVWLKEHGVSVAGASGRKIRLYLLEDSALADQISGLPEVALMPEYVQPKLHNDVARTLLGLDSTAGNPGAGINQTGEGEIVAVADTGLDENHPDIQNQIHGVVALGRPGDASDPHGHGTHVAGSVLGDGTASSGQIRGAAPKAKLFFQSLLDAQGELGGLPLNLHDLFDEAYQNGARIHNNSWGSEVPGVYTFDSSEVDEFVAKNRDMLIVISAGNEGQASERLHSQPGFVDWLSVSSPATCKNALTVGASRSSRTGGGYSMLTYGTAWPQDFPDPPTASANVSGDPEDLAGFSSRGPCDDRRIKPDVVAPGTDIASAKSSRAPLRNFWGAYPGNSKYAFMGGTSMAAPLVSGCAALVREYFVKERGHQPSAALVKATLINGTRWLTGTGAAAGNQTLANFDQGFGCIYMPAAIPNASHPNVKLEFIDTWMQPQRQFTRTGQRFRYQVSISGGTLLRICLAYTDAPGRSLQNNLNLFVEHTQTHKKWIGNESLLLGITKTDTDNNVEVLRLEQPPAGTYLIQVSASNLLHPPQDFALVLAGELASNLLPI